MNKTLLGAAFSLTLLTAAAHATPLVGTFAGAFGVTTPNTLINVGSSLDINPGFATSKGTGDLSGISFGTALTGPTTPFSLTNGTTFDFTVAGFGLFSGTTSDVVLTSGSTNFNRTVRFFALGNFAPTFGGFTAGPSSITGSFTQTGGANSAVSFSFTFASPPVAAPVPAPASLAILGLGIAALGAARRKR